ncbi:MAG: NAD(P)-binding domain-containing protein, partial [Planctomycetota bacterium]
MTTLWQRLTRPKTSEPSYPLLPAVSDSGETNVPGIYAAGELAGTPLVKLGLNAGHALVERIAPELKEEARSEDILDLVIVGSGSSGFAATVAAKDLGLRAVTLEADKFANTFVTMTKGKLLFAEPLDVPVRGRVWFEECRKEELLDRWRQMIDDEKLDIREQEKVTDIRGSKGDFTVVTGNGEYRARRVLLCLGKAGNPRKLGVPGEREHASKVHHRLLDPADYQGQDVLIVGAGDVACEAAIALAADGRNRVTLSAIDRELTFPKKRNIDAIRSLEREGHLRIELDSKVTRIDSDAAIVMLSGGQEERLPNDVVFEMIGAELPLAFLKKVGIRLAGSWTPKKWLILAAIFVFVYSLYALKSYGKGATAWPFESLISQGTYDSILKSIFQVAFAPFAWLFDDAARQDIYADRGFQQGYLYSGLYTLIMLVFGGEVLLRWRKKAKN